MLKRREKTCDKNVLGKLLWLIIFTCFDLRVYIMLYNAKFSRKLSGKCKIVVRRNVRI